MWQNMIKAAWDWSFICTVNFFLVCAFLRKSRQSQICYCCLTHFSSVRKTCLTNCIRIKHVNGETLSAVLQLTKILGCSVEWHEWSWIFHYILSSTTGFAKINIFFTQIWLVGMQKSVMISSIIMFQCIPYGSRTPFWKCLAWTM